MIATENNIIALALDLGGTNARFAAITADGKILSRLKLPTLKNGSTEEMVAFIIDGFEQIRADAASRGDVLAAAAAVPVAGSSEGGVLEQLPNIPELEGINLQAILIECIRLPALIENDATAATIGEHWLGASRGVDNVIGITLGTGVGGGLIMEGKAFRGKNGTAGEVGHICVEPDGHPCGCGSRGCVEQYSSGTAIVRMAIEAGIDVDTPLKVYDLANEGDGRAISVFAEMGRYLGIALAGLVNVLNPDAIVMGGGVSAGWNMFIEHTRSEVSERAFREPAERVNIVRASLGEDAGVLGAARVAFDRFS